ncbi:HAD family hydrolase [Martelella soudanensis]|uniref:HAD family hydrolase n=1 Tax=unclassified Martelella TaxID=2629616 RepID=UPI0015DE2DC9|nr:MULTISPECIES: HAD family phosphatase [unclassified Martelella]
MTAEIRHIVYDIGQVLVHYDPLIPFKRIIPDEEKRSWFFAEVCTGAWNHEQDRGRAWAEAEAEAIARHPDEADNIRAFRAHWEEMIPYCYEDSVTLFRKLTASERDVTLLTNFAPDTFSICRARYPFLEESRGITVSGEVGMVKPDRDIFERHAETFGLTPEATLFIDDKAVNIEGARSIGWHGIQFHDAAQLERDLAEHGIIV